MSECRFLNDCLSSNDLVIHGFSVGLFKDDFSTALVLYHQKVGLFSVINFKTHRAGFVVKCLKSFPQWTEGASGKIQESRYGEFEIGISRIRRKVNTRFTSC